MQENENVKKKYNNNKNICIIWRKERSKYILRTEKYANQKDLGNNNKG